MRKLAMLGVALMAAGAADAQRMVQHGPGAPYPMPGPQGHPGSVVMPPPAAPMPTPPSSRWGSRIGGHWWGGMNAPGGWAAYRQPFRGYRLPTYWVAPRFYVTNWSSYGLPAPMPGYSWTRYYDDAVMIDHGGSVYDYRSGLDWDGVGYADAPRPSSGAGGAIAGAVVGGVAGNVIGGRGNRLAGTLVGAGVGAAAGYAIDRAHDRGRDVPPPPPPPPGAGYPEPGYGGDYREPPMAPDYPPPPPPHGFDHGERRVIIHREGGDYPPPGGWRSEDGRTTVTTTTGGGYYGERYETRGPVIVTPAYGSVTTITVQSQPVVTTTTTDIVEDSVTYTRRPVVRRVYRQRVWHAPTKLLRRARCACGS